MCWDEVVRGKITMKRGSKVKILDEDSEYYRKIGILAELDVECTPLCSVCFDDGDFDYFSEDEIVEVG